MELEPDFSHTESKSVFLGFCSVLFRVFLRDKNKTKLP